MIPESGAKYPFVIMNTDPNDKKGTYWWSFLGLQPRKEILMFDSFGFESFKEFLIKTFKRYLFNKIFYSVEKFDKKDSKIILVTLSSLFLSIKNSKTLTN